MYINSVIIGNAIIHISCFFVFVIRHVKSASFLLTAIIAAVTQNSSLIAKTLSILYYDFPVV